MEGGEVEGGVMEEGEEEGGEEGGEVEGGVMEEGEEEGGEEGGEVEGGVMEEGEEQGGKVEERWREERWREERWRDERRRGGEWRKEMGYRNWFSTFTAATSQAPYLPSPPHSSPLPPFYLSLLLSSPSSPPLPSTPLPSPPLTAVWSWQPPPCSDLTGEVERRDGSC